MASVDKLSSGRWQARYRDPEGKQCKRSFPRKSDAVRFLTGVESRLLDGSYVDPARARITVGEWATRWYAGRVNLKPKTLASYDSLLSRRIRPTWETTPLSRVEHSAVVAWVAEMRADGLSASRTRQAYHLLTAMLNDAVKDNRLSRNPAAGVDLPRLPKGERRYLTHQQVEELAQECGEYRTLVLTLAYCGVRWGEAAALRVRRVDLMRGRLDITEAMTEVNGRAVFGTPKSHQVRSVPVPRFLRDDLMVQLAGKGPDDFVFPSPAGAVLRVNNWRRACFNRAAE